MAQQPRRCCTLRAGGQLALHLLLHSERLEQQDRVAAACEAAEEGAAALVPERAVSHDDVFSARSGLPRPFHGPLCIHKDPRALGQQSGGFQWTTSVLQANFHIHTWTIAETLRIS